MSLPNDRFCKEIIKCCNFAAVKHKDQRRKNLAKTPYINHPIGKYLKFALLPRKEKNWVMFVRAVYSSSNDSLSVDINLYVFYINRDLRPFC